MFLHQSSIIADYIRVLKYLNPSFHSTSVSLHASPSQALMPNTSIKISFLLCRFTSDCFRLGWPMHADADFLCEPEKSCELENNGDGKPIGMHRRAAKVNFLEIRSYWHVFRSFDKMWSFFILFLQAVIIVAWNGDGNPTSIFESNVFKKVLSVFITASILKLGQAVLDVVLNWKARQCMPFYVKLRYLLKVVSAATWVVILPVTYAYTSKDHGY
ncbi:putative 1,3-beta-glucan synthase [Helianthus anomalus]